MEKFSHSAVGITLHEPLLRLTEALPEVMPIGMNMFFFGNSGSEAIEGALKLARYVTGAWHYCLRRKLPWAHVWRGFGDLRQI
jgi:adenosylmethionine-8-amino-7-oxononanoate aminotransferase